MYEVKTVSNEQFKVSVIHDEHAESPREWDNLGTMVCFHRRYNLGDSHHFDNPSRFLWRLAEELGASERLLETASDERLLSYIERRAVILPLYLYDHGGITMSTSGFSCRWDSGQVGWIYATHEDIKREYGKKRLKRAKALLEAEVETYDLYIRGEVWGYVVERATEDGFEQEDSCWGYLGYWDRNEDMKQTIEHIVGTELTAELFD